MRPPTPPAADPPVNPRRPRPALPCRARPGARPPRFPALVLGAVLVAGCTRAEPPRLAQGDSVRVVAAQLGKIGDCTALLVPTPPPPHPPTRFTQLSFDSVTALSRGAETLPVEALRRAYGRCNPF
jgi:hypothetical protein